jgi:GTP cyclohydrolase I
MTVSTDSRTGRDTEALKATALGQALAGAQSTHLIGDIADPDWTAAVAGLQAVLRLAGLDPAEARLAGTPERVIRALMAACDRSGLEAPERLLTKRFEADVDAHTDGDAGDWAGPLMVGPVQFTSWCEHHLMPFRGSVWLGYVPQRESDGYVGLSKLARLVAWHARGLGMQERLTKNLLLDLRTHLKPASAAVKITAEHTCMSCRGASAVGALTTTWRIFGDGAPELLAGMQ